VNVPRRKQRGIYGFAPMVCIPKPIMLVFSILFYWQRFYKPTYSVQPYISDFKEPCRERQWHF